MESFPTVHHLANATEEQVNAHWAGLGFYRRARSLHQGAKYVVKDLDGQLPKTVDGLLLISGIGPYTANAVASIAFDMCVPVVDGNVCRVLSRLTGIANHIKAPIVKDKLGWQLAQQLVEAGDDDDDVNQHAGEVNQAMMELGATYCAPSGTGVDPRDPLKDFYQSTKLGRAYHAAAATTAGEKTTSIKAVSDGCPCPLCDSAGIELVLDQFATTIHKNLTTEEAAKCGHAVFPLDPPKAKKREEDLAVAAVANVYQKETWWLLVKRPSKGLLAGQWEFPSVCVQTRTAKTTATPPKAQARKKALTNYLQELTNGHDDDSDDKWISGRRTAVDPSPLEHIFSHVKHIMWVETCQVSIELDLLEWTTSQHDKEVRWMREQDMKQVGITSGVKKILKAVKAAVPSVESSGRKRKKR
jgi:A/G-specific adenine glycosylase